MNCQYKDNPPPEKANFNLVYSYQKSHENKKARRCRADILHSRPILSGAL